MEREDNGNLSGVRNQERVREGRGSEAIPSCIFLGLAPLRKRVMEYQGVLDDSDSEKEGMVRILLS